MASVGGRVGSQLSESRYHQEQTLGEVPGSPERQLYRTNIIQRGLQMVFRMKRDASVKAESLPDGKSTSKQKLVGIKFTAVTVTRKTNKKIFRIFFS